MEFLGPPPAHDLTYSDVFLVPSRSDVGSRLAVNLDAPDAAGAHIPLVSANMNAVTGPRMAAAIARRGGLAVLPQDLDTAAAQQAVAWVKARDVLVDAPFTFPGTATVAEVLRTLPAVRGQAVAIVSGAQDANREDAAARSAATGQDAGELAERTARDAAARQASTAEHGADTTGGDIEFVLEASILARFQPDARLADLRHHAADVINLPPNARTAFDTLAATETGFAAVQRDGRILGGLSTTSALRSTLYTPAQDAAGHLRVACAVGITGDVLGRARALVEAGADVLVLDTAHGHQELMLRALETVRAADLGVPLVAGNVVTAAGARDLARAGAHIIKVGVGPGAMCTTRMMTAVGRPQFSAVLETAAAAAHHDAAVWADGGIRYPRDVALALAAGASAVMIGSWFAGTVEAPGTVHEDAQGRHYKESFGMASSRAVAARFAALDPYERARKLLFAEGISNSTILIDPARPSVDDLIDMITTGVRSSFTYAGAKDVREFHVRAKVGVQSAAGYEEGKALPVSW